MQKQIKFEFFSSDFLLQCKLPAFSTTQTDVRKARELQTPAAADVAAGRKLMVRK
jgi:hypothetical protein